MSNARVVAPFQHILASGFGGDFSLVLTNLTNPEKWEGLYGTVGFQRQLAGHAELVNSKLTEDILRLQDSEARKLASLFLQLSFTFLTGISDFIMCWYWNLDGAKVYDKSNVWNPVCKLVHRIFEEIHLFRSVASYSYLGIDPGIQFDTYSCASLFTHETMEQFLRYTFDYHPSMFVSTIQFKVCDFLSNQTSNLKVGLEKLNRLRDQVKLLSDNLTKFESNQNYT